MTLLVLAKLCGEDRPSGIAEWAKERVEWLCAELKLQRMAMPHRSSYTRILEKVVSWVELEQLVTKGLSGERYFGKQVLVAIDGKVLRGTLDEAQNGVYLLAAYLPRERLVEKTEEIVPKERKWTVYYFGFAHMGWTEAARQYARKAASSSPQGKNWYPAGMELLDLDHIDEDLDAWSG